MADLLINEDSNLMFVYFVILVKYFIWILYFLDVFLDCILCSTWNLYYLIIFQLKLGPVIPQSLNPSDYSNLI